MTVSQCIVNGCSHIIVKSNVQLHEIEIPVIECFQNGLMFYTTSMSIDDVMMFADIPAMDGTLDCEGEANYAFDSINTVAAGNVPSRWQRPTKMSRMGGANGIPNWLAGSVNRTMPDGILIGVREQAHHNGNVQIDQNNVTIIGGRNIRTATITNSLDAGCPVHGPYQDAQGNQIYQNRCEIHDCDAHESTTSPLSIIDGQHRTIGLHMSNINDKHVAISLLPIQSTVPGKTGYPIQRQAVIFQQVNSKAKPLIKEHLHWLKRMFGSWSIPPAPIFTTGPDGRKAYDLLSYLGSNPLPAPANPVWVNNIRVIEAGNPNEFLGNILFLTDPSTGSIQGTAAMTSNIDELYNTSAITGQTVQEIANNWLDAWILEVGVAFVPVTGLFYNNRAFASLLRTMHISMTEMLASGVANMGVVEFRGHINPYSVELAQPSWDRFRNEGGEGPQRNLFNILKTMLRSGGVPGPAHTTFPNAAGNPPSWAEWVDLPPDPITAFNLPTQMLGGSNLTSADLNAGNARGIANLLTTLTWDAPINIEGKPSGYWRRAGAAGFTRINGFGNTVMPQDVCDDVRTNTLDLGNLGGQLNQFLNAYPPGTDWDLRVVYSTSAGKETDMILGFTT